MVDQRGGSSTRGQCVPLLANVYLHYVFDLWARQWRKRHAHGEVIIVRFADDYIVGFEHRDDAERFLAELRGRLAQFSLELAAEKTRLIEFGRFAAERRKARGLGKPETLGFLGFTWLASILGVAQRPDQVTWRMVIGVGALAGIGFTISLFIAGLAFGDGEMREAASLGVLIASLLAAGIGYAILSSCAEPRPKAEAPTEG